MQKINNNSAMIEFRYLLKQIDQSNNCLIIINTEPYYCKELLKTNYLTGTHS